jgi:hypothetical protein
MVHGANMVVLVAVSSCAAAATWVWKLNHACFPSTSRERRRRRACRLGRTAIYDWMIGVAYGTSMTRPASLSLALSVSVSVSRENKRARLLESQDSYVFFETLWLVWLVWLSWLSWLS